ncbi:MAG: DUF5320 domain-containing protein [Ignavibacteriales bacterium]|nr:DUF5320 domain-containing protein [Ignavibacteriales bacterium]
MSNFDGTGPRGQGTMTGRRRDRCRDTQTKQIEKTENQHDQKNNIVYGLGRGGRPRGGGGFGQGQRGQQGQGRRRGFGRNQTFNK